MKELINNAGMNMENYRNWGKKNTFLPKIILYDNLAFQIKSSHFLIANVFTHKKRNFSHRRKIHIPVIRTPYCLLWRLHTAQRKHYIWKLFIPTTDLGPLQCIYNHTPWHLCRFPHRLCGRGWCRGRSSWRKPGPCSLPPGTSQWPGYSSVFLATPPNRQ